MSGILAAIATSAQSLAAAASPTDLTGFKLGNSGTVVSLQTCTVTASGGQPGYTYLWTYVSGDIQIGAISSNSPSTKFSAYFATAGTSEAIFKCVVTDALATVVDSNNVTVTLTCEP